MPFAPEGDAYSLEKGGYAKAQDGWRMRGFCSRTLGMRRLKVTMLVLAVGEKACRRQANEATYR
jgi:hypothetical protein